MCGEMRSDLTDSRPADSSSSTAARPSAAGRSRGISRTRLGAGLVEIPEIPAIDPARAVMADPQVPEKRRFCTTCRQPVGRGDHGTPGRSTGFCRRCGTQFSFTPALVSGDLVARQYEVAGCLAHGGMGWIYLARDRNVSDRWVVLKGLIDADDPDATVAALAERRFLAEVEHPNIVRIFNFVEHEGLGYIVMEYVGGQSLGQILDAQREANGGEPDPLAPEQAIAYILEILPALGHLHDLGLLFCDLKIDNILQTRHAVKLIDLGGVYRLGDPEGALFGTVGYQAPEVSSLGPSIASDLFTVARTLAVLCIDFRGYQSDYRFALPAPADVPLFERYDSLYRFLLKGTATRPEDRFQTAEEMADQLFGVLVEVVADRSDVPVTVPSTLFTTALRAGLERPDWRVLARPQVSPDDPSAGYLATITATDPDQVVAQLRAAPERTTETELRLVAVMLDAGWLADADDLLSQIEAEQPCDWRVDWYRGIAAMAQTKAEKAVASFDDVYAALPGESAPKLALGLACESAGDLGAAARWYEIVARTDPSITAASFGLARCRMQGGDRAGALVAYERVPDTSSGYTDAQIARIRCLSAPDGDRDPTLDELIAAGTALEALPLEGEQKERLTVRVLDAALLISQTGRAADQAPVRVLGLPLDEHELRLALERSYRELARHAASRAERIALVDDANRVRPRTWI
jgi:serine/threonine-protein kinase PknG